MVYCLLATDLYILKLAYKYIIAINNIFCNWPSELEK